MPATAGGSTSGSSTRVIASERPRNAVEASRYATGVPMTTIRTLATAFVRAVTAIASRTAGSAEEVRDAVERHLGEQRDDRQREEGQRDARGEREQHREGGAARARPRRAHYERGGSPKPKRLRTRRPFVERTRWMKRFAPDVSAPGRRTAQIW